MVLLQFLYSVPAEPTPHPEWIMELCALLKYEGVRVPCDLIWWDPLVIPVEYWPFLKEAQKLARFDAQRAIVTVA
jgi:hypothetical protein